MARLVTTFSLVYEIADSSGGDGGGGGGVRERSLSDWGRRSAMPFAVSRREDLIHGKRGGVRGSRMTVS